MNEKENSSLNYNSSLFGLHTQHTKRHSRERNIHSTQNETTNKKKSPSFLKLNPKKNERSEKKCTENFFLFTEQERDENRTESDVKKIYVYIHSTDTVLFSVFRCSFVVHLIY